MFHDMFVYETACFWVIYIGQGLIATASNLASPSSGATLRNLPFLFPLFLSSLRGLQSHLNNSDEESTESKDSADEYETEDCSIGLLDAVDSYFLSGSQVGTRFFGRHPSLIHLP